MDTFQNNENTLNLVIILRNATAEQIENINVDNYVGNKVLRKGEMILNTTTNGYRIGDGITSIKYLPEIGGVETTVIKQYLENVTNINQVLQDAGLLPKEGEEEKEVKPLGKLAYEDIVQAKNINNMKFFDSSDSELSEPVEDAELDYVVLDCNFTN